MSLLKSLQSIPAVITIFHSPNSPLSSKLLSELNKHVEVTARKPTKDSSIFGMRGYFAGEKAVPFRYTVDVTEKLPTKDQFDYIKSTLSVHPTFKNIFKKVFPTVTSSLDKASDLQAVDFSSLKSLNGTFNPPLVVDWEHKLIASDEKSLKKILDQYHVNED
ncbi:unnamed protein product [Ambrosiozyma monospora]|uniref:Unnamed protein product n=1 Tax=Ambrosiozyma monospora TaxID=43982 RepID=A0A9W7DGQ4_AMBMO|nr:unnamed protein product [Ambrosiozyma monospora]